MTGSWFTMTVRFATDDSIETSKFADRQKIALREGVMVAEALGVDVTHVDECWVMRCEPQDAIWLASSTPDKPEVIGKVLGPQIGDPQYPNFDHTQCDNTCIRKAMGR